MTYNVFSGTLNPTQSLCPQLSCVGELLFVIISPWEILMVGMCKRI